MAGGRFRARRILGVVIVAIGLWVLIAMGGPPGVLRMLNGSSGQEIVVTVAARTGCLPAQAPSLGGVGLSSVNDPFTLRKPGNGFSNGDVLAVATSRKTVSDCYLEVHFPVPSDTQFFVVVDENQGVRWGPLDVKQVEANGWHVSVSL